MYLHQKISREGVCFDRSGAMSEAVADLLKPLVPGILRATRVDVQNIDDYIRSQNRDFFDFTNTDGLIPPWSEMWLEWRDMKGRPRSIFVVTEAVHESEQSNPHRTDARWRVGCYSFSDFTTEHLHRVFGPLVALVIFLDEQGTIVDGTDSSGWIVEVKTPFTLQLDEREREVLRDDALLTLFFTCQFANCRNVERIEVVPCRQRRRAAERKGEPVNSHYVLAIDAATQRNVYPGREHMPSHQRLHICRGHFATYTEERPLFGKYSGRFWVPAHVRGSSEQGVVGKDYRVKAV